MFHNGKIRRTVFIIPLTGWWAAEGQAVLSGCKSQTGVVPMKTNVAKYWETLPVNCNDNTGILNPAPTKRKLTAFRQERKWENKKQRKEKSLSIVTYCPPSPPLRYSPAGDDRLRHRLDPMLTTHAGLHTCLLREGICKDKENDNDRVHRQLHLAINENSFTWHNYFLGRRHLWI